jgi:hypothetical protein
MAYFADFRERETRLFRFDTRVYLQDGASPGPKDRCIAAIIAKNPGSAFPTRLGALAPLNIGKDKMLPTVRNRFCSAYNFANKTIPPGAFVRVWNLFYLCNAGLAEAIAALSEVQEALNCSSESVAPRIIWFAWGGPHFTLDLLKARFTKGAYVRPFFYDKNRERIVERVPQGKDFPKHPQGLPEHPVVDFLKSVI